MASNNKDLFNFEYESSSSGSYLVATAPSNTNLVNYQIEMISQNLPSGMLPVTYRRKDNDEKLYYNITSKLVLASFLKRKKITIDDFIKIVNSITTTLMNCSNYFLSEKSFYIDKNYIYINPSNLEIQLVYLPVETQTNVCLDLKDFIIDLIVNSADFEEDKEGNYIQKILTFVKQDLIDIAQLHDFFINLKDKTGTKNPAKTVKSEGKKPVSKVSGESTSKPNKPSSLDIPINTPEPKKAVLPVEKKASSHKVQSSEKIHSKAKPYSLPIFIVSIVVLLVLGILSFSWLVSVLEDTVSAIVAILLVSGGALIIIYRELFKNSNSSSATKSSKPFKQDTHNENIPVPGEKNMQKNKNIDMSKSEIRSTPHVYSKEPSKNSYANSQTSSKSEDLVSSMPVKSIRPEKTAPGNVPSNTEDTVILGMDEVQNPYLKSVKNGVCEQISINKSPFTIGRIPNQCDYICNNSTIGKIHAEILSKEGLYYLKDINSRNGTFINGKRIASNEYVQLENNDTISFSNSSYLFVIPEL